MGRPFWFLRDFDCALGILFGPGKLDMAKLAAARG